MNSGHSQSALARDPRSMVLNSPELLSIIIQLAALRTHLMKNFALGLSPAGNHMMPIVPNPAALKRFSAVARLWATEARRLLQLYAVITNKEQMEALCDREESEQAVSRLHGLTPRIPVAGIVSLDLAPFDRNMSTLNSGIIQERSRVPMSELFSISLSILIPQMTSLRALALSDLPNHILCPALQDLPKLEYFRFSHGPLSGDQVEQLMNFLVMLSRWPRIRVFVYKVALSARWRSSVAHSTKLAPFRYLQTLDLCYANEDTLEALLSAARKSLKSLSLRKTRGTWERLIPHLRPLAHRLERLYLGDASIPAMVYAARTFTNLVYLGAGTDVPVTASDGFLDSIASARLTTVEIAHPRAVMQFRSPEDSKALPGTMKRIVLGNAMIPPFPYVEAVESAWLARGVKVLWARQFVDITMGGEVAVPLPAQSPSAGSVVPGAASDGPVGPPSPPEQSRFTNAPARWAMRLIGRIKSGRTES